MALVFFIFFHSDANDVSFVYADTRRIGPVDGVNGAPSGMYFSIACPVKHVQCQS
jgi:hypothetical protein